MSPEILRSLLPAHLSHLTTKCAAANSATGGELGVPVKACELPDLCVAAGAVDFDGIDLSAFIAPEYGVASVADLLAAVVSVGNAANACGLACVPGAYAVDLVARCAKADPAEFMAELGALQSAEASQGA